MMGRLDNEMKKANGRRRISVRASVFVFSGLLALAPITASRIPAARETHSLALQGLPVELVFRSLQPGEAIMAVLKDDPSAKRVTLQVRDAKYVLGGTEPGAKPFALIGIDVAAKAEPLAVRVIEEKTDGTLARFDEDLTVDPREFPKRHFQVEEAMLNPPPREQERVMREADLIQSVFDLFTPEWLATGSFHSPLPDREPFPNFGQLRIYNKTRQSVHAGVDIAAPWGAPVLASNAGRVVLASRMYLSGGTVIIDHGRGVFTFYCHFSKLLVKRGDMVKRGQPIAKVGNTGRSTGPHLHWAVRIRDVRVDPFSLVGLPLE
jgi:murein DD-endopeptidase MepM/ murein hydrolase activator NlpD